MSPEIYQQSKNVFLIFPPGCGGNHLANMLSLHPDFEPRYQSETYEDEIIYSYKNHFTRPKLKGRYLGDCAVHFSDLENLQPDYFEKYKDIIFNTSKKYIFCSHAYEYIMSKRVIPELNKLTNKIFIMLTRPTKQNMVAYLRWSTGPWSMGEPKINALNLREIPDSSKIYNVKSFSSVTGVPEDNILLIDTDLYYAINGTAYIDEVLKENFGITLTPQCKELHDVYINDKVNIYGSMMP